MCFNFIDEPLPVIVVYLEVKLVTASIIIVACVGYFNFNGGLSEWFKEAVLKTVDHSRGPGVRIPHPPPIFQFKSTSQIINLNHIKESV